MLLQTIWISPPLIFSAGLYFWRCPEAALLEFSTSYLPETTLRLDNIFVFVFLFTSLAIMRVSQQ